MAHSDVINKIVTLDDHGNCLLEKAAPLAESPEGLTEANQVVTRLMKSLAPLMPAAGLAAPQIGISKQVFIFSWDRSVVHLEAAINPSFVATDEQKERGWEGCFSVRLKLAQVPRYQSILASYTNMYGEKVSYRLEGFAARVFQHEYDHLHGVENIHRPDAEVRNFVDSDEMMAFIREVKRNDVVNYLAPVRLAEAAE